MTDGAAEARRRIGVMGGTFDPIHLGHLVAASEVAHRLHLDRVIFVPAGDPWQKADTGVSAAEHRYAMTVIATAGDHRFLASRVDIEREGPTYTDDTLRDLLGELRAAGEAPADLFFIAGTDALSQASTWHSFDGVLELAKIVAVSRPGHDRRPPGTIGERCELIQIPGIDISSTQCRERARLGQPLAYVVPAAVERYIAKVGLYLDGSA